MSTSILALSHSFVVDTNRSMLSELAQLPGFEVDIVVPRHWKSNLIKDLYFSHTKDIDDHFTNIFPLEVIAKGNASFFSFNPYSLYKILKEKKYQRIFLAQETWSFALLFINICKFFTVNKSTQIDLWVCQNIKKRKLHWMKYFERLNTLSVGNILHCCDEIKEVVRWKGIKNSCRYFPFSFAPKEYKENFEKRNKKPEHLTVGYLGRLSEEKGTDQLLKTFEQLLKQSSSLRVKIAGGGPDGQKVEAFCAQNDRCDFLGILKHNEAHLFYRDLDLFILASQTRPFWKEQFGRVIIEAAASGCNFVGSSSGAIPEVMAKCDLNFSYDEKSQEDLLRKVNLALKEIESESYHEKQLNRYELAMKQFSHKAVAKLYQTYLDVNHGD